MAELITVARPYARALISSVDAKDSDKWLPIMQLCESFAQSRDARRFLALPDMNVDILKSFFDKAAAQAKLKEVPPLFFSFLNVVVKHKRSVALPEIATLFIEAMNNENQAVSAKIISAKKLKKEDQVLLVTALEKRLQKKVDANLEVDDTLIGGAVIKVGDMVIDGSVKGRIEKLSKALIE